MKHSHFHRFLLCLLLSLLLAASLPVTALAEGAAPQAEPVQTAEEAETAEDPETPEDPEDPETPEAPDNPAPSEDPDQPEDPEDPAQNEQGDEKDDKDDKDEKEDEEEPRDEIAWGEEVQADPALQFTLGELMAGLALREYDEYGGERCGSRYWGTDRFSAWSAGFVSFLAEELGLTGEKSPFGLRTNRVPQAARQLLEAGAAVLYPEDENEYRPGDILFWWCGGHPGRESDKLSPDSATHMGVITEWDPEKGTVTVVEGGMGSWAPTRCTLTKNTYRLAEPMFGSVYPMAVLRPNYPALFTADQPELIQAGLCRLLYGQAGGMVSCDFDGYTTTEGRHEGIDFSFGEGAAVYSLTEGEVIRIVSGSRDGHLSTVCVYDAAYNRTVVYLHLAPSDALEIGVTVHPGDLLGQEDRRGATVAHTHVEVVDGRSYAANVSVGDEILDNQNPYPYWAAMLSRSLMDHWEFYRTEEGLRALSEDLDAPEHPLPQAVVRLVLEPAMVEEKDEKQEKSSLLLGENLPTSARPGVTAVPRDASGQ